MFNLLTKNVSLIKNLRFVTNCRKIATIRYKSSESRCANLKNDEQLSGQKSRSDAGIDFQGLDPDDFGNVVKKFGDATGRRHLPLKAEKLSDDADGYDKLFIKRGQKKSPQAYRRILQEYLREKPLNFAEILKLHREYLYEDRYIPERIWFTMMFDACAQVGHTKKALELLNEMKRFELKPTKAGVTALLNSCANCSLSKEYGLQQAIQIRDQLQLDGYEFNDIQYNCLIKTFATLGDSKNALLTLDELQSKGHVSSKETYAALLMGAIQNRASGLLPARDWFIQLLQSGQSIDISSFNLFLRAIRDCRVEEEKLKQLCEGTSTLFLDVGKLQESRFLPANASVSEETMPCSSELPSILTGNKLQEIVAINFDSLVKPQNRFQLFGGIQQFEALMDAYRVKPNLKTITLLIDLFFAREFYAKITTLLDRYRLKPDITLYNVMIKKAAKSNQRALCKEILAAMVRDGIEPDVMTFGALTFQCSNLALAKRLLGDMNRLGAAPNNKILGSLLNIACKEADFEYLNFLLDYIQRKSSIKLTRLDIEQIDLMLKKTKNHILKVESLGGELPDDLVKNYDTTRMRFVRLLKETKIRINENPWSEFEASSASSGKTEFTKFSELMKAKNRLKHGRDPVKKKTSNDYYDQIDE